MTQQADTTILIVDDSNVSQSVARGVLERNGYRVAVAQDGAEGLQLAHKALPDLILLDVMMPPGMDGFEVCRHLKAEERTRDIPVIFMTTLDSVEDKVKGFKSGGVDYVTKPLQVDEVLARISTHLKLHAAQRQLAEQNAHLEQRVAERTAELAEREMRFRSLAESMPDIIVRYDLGARAIYLNPRIEATLGVAARNLLGKTPQEAFPGGEFAHYQARIEAVIETGQGTEMDITQPDTGAGLRYHQVRLVAERGASDEVVSVLTIARDVTEHRRAGRELVRLNRAINASTDAAFLMDERGRFIYVNDAACRGLGYSRDELLTMTSLDINPDVSPEVFEGLLRSILEGRPGAGFIESCHRTCDGRVFPVELSASLIEDDDAKFCLVMARDISFRRRMDDALHFVAQRSWMADGENFFDALARYLGQSLGVDYVVIDRLGEAPGSAETVALYAKDSIVPNMRYSLAGTPCENVMGRNYCCYPRGIRQLFPEDSLLVDMEAESYAGIPLWDSAGQPIGLIAVMDGKPLADEAAVAQLLQLVSSRVVAELERERSDAELRARELKFRSLADNSPDNILRHDRGCRMIYMNSRLEALWGVAARNLLGKTPLEAFPNGEFADYQACVAAVIDTGQPTDIEITLPDAGAGIRYHSVRIVAEHGPQGEVVGVLGVGRDVTERRHLEDELRRTLSFRQLLLAELASIGMTLMVLERGKVMYNSDSHFGRRLGYAEGELGEALGFLDLVHPDDRARVADMYRRRLAGEAVPSSYEVGALARDGSRREFEFFVTIIPDSDPPQTLVLAHDIGERKQAESARQARLHFVESLDRIDRAIQGANDLEEMMRNLLDEVLSIFDCDRAALVYPCDPSAAEWQVPMERTKPEYPGALAQGMVVPMDDEVAAGLRILLDAAGPVKIGPGSEHPLPSRVSERFGIKSYMALAVYPWGDNPWQFVIHQCSHARVWTTDEERILHEIGRRLADGLTSLLAHRQVKESEAHLRTLVQTIPDLVWLKSPDGVFMHCNPQVERLLGATTADIVGKTDYDFVDRELADFFRENDRKAATGKPLINEEWLTFAADGYRGLFETIKTPLRDDAGKLIGILGVARDITERWAMEDALRNSEQEFRSLAENSPDIIIRYDRECRRTYVNPAYEREIELPVNAVVGYGPAETDWHFDLPAANYTDMLRQVMVTGETREEIMSRIRSTDGITLRYSIRFVAERSADGRVIGALAVGRNITDLVETQRKLEESSLQLRDLASRRETAREEERRRIARELHDELGQQLTALRFDVKLFAYHFGKDKPELKEVSDNLLRLVDKSILTTRQVSSALRPAVLDMGIIPALEWLVAEYGEHANVSFERKGMRGDLRMNEESAIVLFRIVQESLTNAARYSHAEHIRVEFAQEAQAYVVEVRDNGVGFDPDGPRDSRSVGLVGIRERVLAVGGELVIFSSPGWGTTIRVSVPAMAGTEGMEE